MLQTQPPQQQPDYLDNDDRSDYEIQRDQRALHRELHAVLIEAVQHYRVLHARQAYNDQVLELREARRRETFNWPQQPPARPAPASMPLVMQQRPQIHHLHGRMGIIVEEERRSNG